VNVAVFIWRLASASSAIYRRVAGAAQRVAAHAKCWYWRGESSRLTAKKPRVAIEPA
jgi:hypothetical protein